VQQHKNAMTMHNLDYGFDCIISCFSGSFKNNQVTLITALDSGVCGKTDQSYNI
jgi:hypothetical protein